MFTFDFRKNSFSLIKKKKDQYEKSNSSLEKEIHSQYDRQKVDIFTASISSAIQLEQH